MKRKSNIYLFLIYLTILNSLLLLTPALALEESKTLIAVEDATIDLYNPATNYGGTNDLEVGYFISWLRSYIKFDLSEAPANFHTVELKLEFIYVEATTLIEIRETSNSWGELTITWANAPSSGNLITSGYIAEDTIYVFDVTDDLESKSGDWSICLTSVNSNWLYLASRQCYSWNEPPRLVYHSTTSDLPLIVGAIVAIVLIACIPIAGYLYRKRNPKGSRQVVKPSQEVSQVYRQQKAQTPQEGMKYCVVCGRPNKKASLFCTECGNKIPV